MEHDKRRQRVSVLVRQFGREMRMQQGQVRLEQDERGSVDQNWLSNMIEKRGSSCRDQLQWCGIGEDAVGIR